MNTLTVHGARENNLKDITVSIPKDKLIVFTGLSGSGKSSLAMDVIYAEGQRRYVESLSSYARQFLGVLKKPDVDRIDGLSPAIAIDQKTVSHNPRSTVGTTTEIYDYLRLLYSKIGIAHCPICGDELKPQTVDQIIDNILTAAKDTLKTDKDSDRFGYKFSIVAVPIVDKKGEYSALFKSLKKQGWEKVRLDGILYNLMEAIPVPDKNKRHTLEVITDDFDIYEFTLKEDEKDLRSKLFQAVDNALKIESKFIRVLPVGDKTQMFPDSPNYLKEIDYSTSRTCRKCSLSLPEFEPRHFSFNSPHGACPVCTGLGFIRRIDERKLLDPNKSVLDGGIIPYAKLSPDSWTMSVLLEIAKRYEIPLKNAVGKIPKEKLDKILYGTGKEIFRITFYRKDLDEERQYNSKFEGLIPNLERRYAQTSSDYIRREIEQYMTSIPCETCEGTRLKKEIRMVTIDGKNIAEITAYPIDVFYEHIVNLPEKLDTQGRAIAQSVLKEISARAKFLLDVGLSYLTLDRSSITLSGGESQRIRLASQIGTGLTGVLYVLDEPSIGLHARDQHRLVNTLLNLRELGNTVIVVEHDKDTILSADHIVDFGPGAGVHGGKVIAEGSPKEIMGNKSSVTGPYLSGIEDVKRNVERIIKSQINEDSTFEHDSNAMIVLEGAKTNNLKGVDVEIPFGKFTCVTGVSGSGKSSLIIETLLPALKESLGYRNVDNTGVYKQISGYGKLDRVVFVDQSPIGRTPRSNPATYTKVFDDIREVFALTRDAKVRGFNKSRFSFNLRGGRCEACKGEGQIKIEMQFMPDVYVDCEVCHGKRYIKEVLDVSYRDKNIADVLDMSIEEGINFFDAHPNIREKLSLMKDVGLSYMKLGQPAPLLSGGEAQRVKLASELDRKTFGRTIYILDEPTTGLHFADMENLLVVLKTLVARGDTVVVIEHNLDFIKLADYIIDIGPEGGDEGGNILYQGDLKGLKSCKESWTGKMLFT
ncbi:excinuclease ABC subunit UvrA [Candidatus Dojkabacteria bacterium]|nr:excinuclease ABC subunit UvrA [Candidatus Dojkabacteria bacterium]